LGALDGVFSSQEIKKIMKKATTPLNKKRVVDITIGVGAFSAPWIIAVNKYSKRKDWFGNNYRDQVFYYLEVPYRPLHIVPFEDPKARL
ncbi:hypothetical protein K469DRAFT_593969, partial [Zopfia rhizophila CBS 207.26]